MRDLLVVLGFLAMLPLALTRAFIGVVLWVWIAFLSPGQFTYGFGALIPFNKIATGATIIAFLLGKDKKQIKIDSSLCLMILFLLLGLISAIFALNESPGNWEIFDKLWKEVLLCIFIASVATTRLRIHCIIIACAAALGFHGTMVGLKFVASGGHHREGGIQSLGDNNQLALAVLMVTPIIYYLYRYSAHVYARYAWLGMSIACILGVIGTFSRGGLIGLLVIAINLVRASRQKFGIIVLVVLSVALLVAFAPETWFSRMNTIETADQDASFMGRVTAWKMSLLVALDRPFVGGGFHAIHDRAVWGRYLKDIGTFDFIPSYVDEIPHAAHSIYFEVLGDLGFIAVAVFISILLIGLLNARRIRKQTKGVPSLLWINDLATVLQLSLIVYGVSGALLSMAYFEFFYVIVTLLAALRRLAESERAMVVAPAPAIAERVRPAGSIGPVPAQRPATQR
jgi:putative inorganic carbon (HCO3(-)) transporter